MLTAQEARLQQENTLKNSSDISEILDSIDKHTHDEDSCHQSFIWWHKPILPWKQKMLEKLGFKVTSQQNNNETEYKISWER